MMILDSLFYINSFIILYATLLALSAKNAVHGLLYFVLSIITLAINFYLLDSPLASALEIMVYAGAIMVLFIFVIMMINIRTGIPPEKKKWTLYLSLGLAVVLIIELIVAIKAAFTLPVSTETLEAGPVSLGRLLFTKYLYPFEITSILIIAALVGAIVLVKKKEKV